MREENKKQHQESSEDEDPIVIAESIDKIIEEKRPPNDKIISHFFLNESKEE